MFAADCRSWKEHEKRSMSFTAFWVVMLGVGAAWGGTAGSATTGLGVGAACGGAAGSATTGLGVGAA